MHQITLTMGYSSTKQIVIGLFMAATLVFGQQDYDYQDYQDYADGYQQDNLYADYAMKQQEKAAGVGGWVSSSVFVSVIYINLFTGCG